MDLTACGIAHPSTNPIDKSLAYLGRGECSGHDIGIFGNLGRRLIATASSITGVDDATSTQLRSDDHLAEVEKIEVPRRSRLAGRALLPRLPDGASAADGPAHVGLLRNRQLDL